MLSDLKYRLRAICTSTTCPFDVWVYTGVGGVLGLVVLMASYLPAHQAARLDPVRTLKQE